MWIPWIIAPRKAWVSAVHGTKLRPRPRALSLSTVDMLSRITLSWGRGGRLVHWRVFSGTPGLYALDARNSSLVAKTKNISRLCQMFPGEQKPPVENR